MNKFKKTFLILSIVFICLSLFVNAFIIYQSCLPGAESSGWSDPVTKFCADVINGIKPETINDTNIGNFSFVIRKLIGHFGLFGFDGVITSLALFFSLRYFHKFKFLLFTLISGGIGLLVAFLTELIQHFVPGRSGEVLDSLIDFSGYVIALAIILLIIYLVVFKRKKKAS